MDIKILMGIMIFLIVGAAMVLPLLASLATVATSAQSVAYDALTCTNTTTQNLRGFLSAGTLTIYNGTTGAAVTIGSGNYTVSTVTYGQTTTVRFHITNTTLYGNGNGCRANYTYYDPTYQTGASSRTMTLLIPVLIALAFIVFIVAYISKK